MAIGALLQIVAFVAAFVVGSIVVVLNGGMAYACGVFVVEYVRAKRKGD